VKDTIGYRIRKLRESKDYSQENMAGELGISTSAYSKIERDVTDPSVGRVTAIAKILDVDVVYFFQDASLNNMGDQRPGYGIATKSDIDDLVFMINKMKHEWDNLKASLQPLLAPPPVKKKRKT